jgi:hypothetical protein
MDEGALRIRQWQVVYHVPRCEISAAQRLNSLLREDIPRELDRIIASVTSEDQGITLIRRLSLDLDLDLGLTDGEISHHCANRFTQTLARSVAGRESDNVVYFPNRRSYLAQFLLDLSCGTAWSAWYYREFEGLKALPAPMALRTAILENPRNGLEALLRMKRIDRARVLIALTDNEARRVLNGLVQSDDQSIRSGKTELKHIIAAMESRDSFNHTPVAEALDLFLYIAASQPEIVSHHLAQLCVGVIALRHIFETFEKPHNIATTIASGSITEFYRLAGHETAEYFQPIFDLPKSQRDGLLKAMARKETRLQAVSSLEEKQRFTLNGGVFLLLPVLINLPAEAIIATWPPPGNTDSLAALRLLVLSQCLGNRNVVSVFRDPVIRDLTGVDPGFTIAEAQQWLNSISANQLRDSLCSFMSWRLAEKDQPTVKVVQLTHKGRRLAVVFPVGSGAWIFLRGCKPSHMKVFTKILKKLAPVSISPDTTSSADTQRLGEDLDYLTLPKCLRPIPLQYNFLRCLSQTILYDFSKSLPGFVGSSLRYLSQNFLTFRAQVSTEKDRHLVCLGRPPLNVILSISGLNRRQYSLPRSDDRMLVLYQEN